MPEPELEVKFQDQRKKAPAKEVRASTRPPELKSVGARGYGNTAKVGSGQQHKSWECSLSHNLNMLYIYI